MNWSWRRRRPREDADGARLARELGQALDPYDDRALVVDGERAVVVPGQVLENIRNRMERIDLDPATSWAPEELMSQEEGVAMFLQLSLGDLVVTDTAWYARQILTRWPGHLVEHSISDEARIELFLEGVRVDPKDGDVARRVLNRALASADRIDAHPELADLSPHRLLGTWLALVLWFGIKSGVMHQRLDG